MGNMATVAAIWSVSAARVCGANVLQTSGDPVGEMNRSMRKSAEIYTAPSSSDRSTVTTPVCPIRPGHVRARLPDTPWHAVARTWCSRIMGPHDLAGSSAALTSLWSCQLEAIIFHRGNALEAFGAPFLLFEGLSGCCLLWRCWGVFFVTWTHKNNNAKWDSFFLVCCHRNLLDWLRFASLFIVCLCWGIVHCWLTSRAFFSSEFCRSWHCFLLKIYFF